jgi:hypothetical protein
MFFSFQTPQAFCTSTSWSERSGNGRPYFSLNFFWDAGESLEIPITATFFFLNASTSSRKSQASRVQPEVIAFG